LGKTGSRDMRVTLNWLKDYVDTDLSPKALGRLLTMVGLEVEEIEAVGQSLHEIVVAEIVKVDPHPDADQLALCQVDAGGNQSQVVCSAPNLFEGARVPLAPPGVKLPNGMAIKESRIRGQASRGMLLAEDEMGLTDDHTGVMILPEDVTPGTPLSETLPLADWVFDVSITPNRADCASVMGIAREIAAATGQVLKRPSAEISESGPPVEDLASVTIRDPLGCPRYAAGIIQEVRLTASPFWLRYRLFLSGIRSINNIVDVTNYVMLEMGQPLHAFDYNRLRQNRILVRRAEQGEAFTTLDGETRSMDKEMLLICDGERPVALAGVMGGLNSEIFAGTKHVLVESAFFDPVTIRRGSKRLGLSTEASYRFERGIDLEGVTTALKRALALMTRLGGGKMATGIIDNYPRPYSPPVIDFSADKTNRFLGTRISPDVMKGYLESLEMEVQETGEKHLRVTPPSFRVDITREVDLMEEVARLDGYDRIPVTYPRISSSEEGEAPELRLRARVREIMVGLGFTEIITYSFISPESADILGAGEKSPLRSFVRLLNPLTNDQSVMRTSLIPGLMQTALTNLLQDERGGKLFEWGKVFIHTGTDQQPVEKTFLAALMWGIYREKSWYNQERRVDFYDIKGSAEVLLKDLGLQACVFQRDSGVPGYHPEVSCAVASGDVRIGQAGRISSKVTEAYDLEREELYVLEIDVQALMKVLPDSKRFEPFAKFPAVYRDLSIIVGGAVESARIVEIIRGEGAGLVESVHLFDLYEGDKVGGSEKSLAFRICYRSKQGTLDGEGINRIHGNIIDRIREKTGGKLKEG